MNTNTNTNTTTSVWGNVDFTKGVQLRLKYTDITTKCISCSRPTNPRHNSHQKNLTCCAECANNNGCGKHTNDCNTYHDTMKDGPI